MRRRTRFAIAILALSCLAAVTAGFAAAKPSPGRGKRQSPEAAIREAVERHNAATGAQFTFVLQMNQDIRECEEQAAAPPEAQIWGTVESGGHALQLIVSKDLRPYGQLIPGWMAAIESVKVPGSAKGAKAKYKKEALEKFDEAQSGHGKEFFAIDGLGNELVLHNCEGARKDRVEAGEVGEPAWLDEADGLVASEKLLGMHGPAISPGSAPYASAGSA